MEGDGADAGKKKLEESWLIVVKNTNAYEEDEDAGKGPETNNNNNNIACLKSSEDLEDSDGISVISESEMYKNNSNHSDGEVEEKPSSQQEEEEEEDTPEEEESGEEEEEESSDKSEATAIEKSKDDERESRTITALKKFEEGVALREVESNKQQQEQQQFAKGSQGVVLLIAVSLIIAVLYTNVTSLKNELAKTVSIYEQRIVRLEQENQVLRSQLEDLMWRLKRTESQPLQSREMRKESGQEEAKYQEYLNTQEPKPREPVTKKVWLGGEKEEVVKILDKKYNSLPDYCYAQHDENDLFYEYNKENCERKKQKLEERIKKLHTKGGVKKGDDEKFKANDEGAWNSKRIDEKNESFMEETTETLLKSLNAEIQNIKSFTDEAIGKFEQAPINEEEAVETREKYNKVEYKHSNKRENGKRSTGYDGNEKRGNTKKRKGGSHQQRSRGGGDSSSEWAEKRSSGREAARKNHESGSGENWYLKRKNDREIHRLGADAHD